MNPNQIFNYKIIRFIWQSKPFWLLKPAILDYLASMSDKPSAYTVSAITRIIKGSLEERFTDIWVEGEISGYHNHQSSGHRYLTLKDERAVLKAVIWRAIGSHLKFEPEDGQKILAYGSIGLYERSGQYQLIIKKLVLSGKGPLEVAFRQLHEKLTAEGLFDASRKKPMPAFPRKVGLVTSPGGAAVRDMIQIARRRNDAVELIVYPTAVQGEGAEKTIAAGIEYFNSRDDIDVIITGRGGGSLEDLWPFNMEMTVRAVAASRVPIVSAVGHEIDTTLSDLAADLRAPTPSAASELVIWSREEFRERIKSNLSTQTYLLQKLTESASDQLRSIMNRPVYRRPLDLINQQRQYLDGLTHRSEMAGKNLFDRAKNRLSLVLARLETLSPLGILRRGYSVTRNLDGDVVKSCDDVSLGQKIETVLGDGKLISVLEKSIRKSNN